MAAPRSPMAARRPTGKDGWRSPAMVLPYLGLIGGTILLARVPEESLARFWWLAPVTLFAFLVLFAATVAGLSRRRTRAWYGSQRLDEIRGELREALGSSSRTRRSTLKRLLPRLAEVRRASESFSENDQAALRKTLRKLEANELVQKQYFVGPTQNERAECLQILGWLADDRSILLLRGVLNGPDSELGYLAAQSLAEFESERACECLVEALRRGSLARPLVATAIESSRFRGAPALLARAVDDPAPEVRAWVADLAGQPT